MARTRGELTTARRTFDESADARPSEQRADAARLVFGEFVVLPDEGRLLRGTHPVPLAPKPFDTLLYLIRHEGRVVSKQELLDAVWPDTFITEDGLVQCVVEIRRALGDSARAPRYIETLPKRGYRLLVPVQKGDSHTYSVTAGDSHSPQTQENTGPTFAPTRAGTPKRVTVRLISLTVPLLLLLVGGAMWLRGGGTDVTAPYHPERGLVLILPIQMVDGLDDLTWLRTGLIDIVSGELTGALGVRLVARHRLDRALAEAGVSDALAISRSDSLKIARLLRAERLVTASVQRVEGQFVLTASILDVAADRVQHELSVRGTQRSDMLHVLGRFSRQIGEALGASSPAAPASAGAPLATSSEAAYRAYLEALDQESSGGREEWLEAEARLTRAVEQDPGFARAYVRLALIQQARGRWGYGTADPRPAVQAANRLASRLPDRERTLIGGLSSLLIDGDANRALASWNTLLKVHPAFAHEAGVPTLIADTLMQQGRWAQLILDVEPHVDAPATPQRDRALLHSILAKAFRKQGEIDRALAHGRQALDLWPARDGVALLRVRTLFGRMLVDAGRAAEAIDLFQAVARDSHADAVNVTDAAWGLYMAGRRDEAARTLERALSLDPGHGNAYHIRGWLSLTGGDPHAAADQFAAAFAKTPVGFGAPDHGVVRGDLAALYYRGVSLHRAGEHDAAATTWRRVLNVCREASTQRGAARLQDATRWHASHCAALASARLGIAAPLPGRLEGDDATYFLMMARLHAVRGERGEALEALRQALALSVGDRRHIQDDPNFESLADDPAFRRLLGLS